jgi:hypothetical protein
LTRARVIGPLGGLVGLGVATSVSGATSNFTFSGSKKIMLKRKFIDPISHSVIDDNLA